MESGLSKLSTGHDDHPEVGDWPRWYGWYAVALFCLVFVCSLTDRMVIGLLAVDLGSDLAITDTQIGLLAGTSFAVVYALAGLPLGYALDRFTRKWLLVGGIALWGMLTIASAFAEGFVELAACRAGVAVGEAVLTPAAVSLIADLFPRDRRVEPMSTVAGVSSLAAVGGLILGALAVDAAQPLVAASGIARWRVVLILVGAPSLVLALVVAATFREPVRGRFDGPQAHPTATSQSLMLHLRKYARFYLPFFVGVAASLVNQFGMITWIPSLLVRAHGYSPSQAGYLFGGLGACCALAGMLFWPRVLILVTRRGVRDPILLVLVIATMCAVPTMIAAPLCSDARAMLVGLALQMFCSSALAPCLSLSVQTYAPPHFRGRVMAIGTLAQSGVGYSVGPPIVASIATFWSGDPRALGYGISVVASVLMPLAALCFIAARRGLIGIDHARQ